MGALDLESRRRLFDEVAANPGIHERELARRLGVHHSLVGYHLRFLVKAGLVVESRDEGFKRYHPALGTAREAGERTPTIEERRWLAALRRGRNVELAILLIESPGMTVGELAGAAGMSISTVSGHVARMESAGLLTSERAGKEKRLAVREPRALAALILGQSWRSQDIVDGFREAWEAMGL